MSALDDVLFAYAMFVIENPQATERLAAARAELVKLRTELAHAQAELNRWIAWKPSNDEYIEKIEAECEAARAELASNKVYQRMAARR